jgi:hypothetical protein
MRSPSLDANKLRYQPLAARLTRGLQTPFQIALHRGKRRNQAQEADETSEAARLLAQTMNCDLSAGGKPSSSQITDSGSLRA